MSMQVLTKVLMVCDELRDAVYGEKYLLVVFFVRSTGQTSEPLPMKHTGAGILGSEGHSTFNSEHRSSICLLLLRCS